MENGEPEPIRKALKSISYMYNAMNWPMNYSVMAYEELPFYDPKALEKDAKKSNIIEFEPVSFELSDKILMNWHPFRAPEIENQPVSSNVPTLMASGGLDHVTPSKNADEALKYLKNGYGVLFKDEGHNIVNPCFFQIAKDFLDEPTRKPNTTCSTEKHPIEWVIK